MDKGGKEWRELTFSQREGKVPLPEALQAGKLNNKFKNQIWLVIERYINNGDIELCDFIDPEIEIQSDVHFYRNEDQDFWDHFVLSYHTNVLEVPHDVIKVEKAQEIKMWMRDSILKKEGHEILTLLEYMLRSPHIPEELANNIESSFELAPYFIDHSDGIATIIPSTSEEAKESIKKSLDNINQSELTGTKVHLRKAAQELNTENFSGSMRESIHAVASAARQIDPKASKDLDAALNSLEKHGIHIHPALKQAFKTLYGYTSNEEGVRKPFVKKESADVGIDEAIFMYSACVAFVDYLASKQRQWDEK